MQTQDYDSVFINTELIGMFYENGEFRLRDNLILEAPDIFITTTFLTKLIDEWHIIVTKQVQNIRMEINVQLEEVNIIEI